LTKNAVTFLRNHFYFQPSLVIKLIQCCLKDSSYLIEILTYTKLARLITNDFVNCLS